MPLSIESSLLRRIRLWHGPIRIRSSCRGFNRLLPMPLRDTRMLCSSWVLVSRLELLDLMGCGMGSLLFGEVLIRRLFLGSLLFEHICHEWIWSWSYSWDDSTEGGALM